MCARNCILSALAYDIKGVRKRREVSGRVCKRSHFLHLELCSDEDEEEKEKEDEEGGGGVEEVDRTCLTGMAATATFSHVSKLSDDCTVAGIGWRYRRPSDHCKMRSVHHRSHLNHGS